MPGVVVVTTERGVLTLRGRGLSEAGEMGFMGVVMDIMLDDDFDLCDFPRTALTRFRVAREDADWQGFFSRAGWVATSAGWWLT